MKFQPKLGRWYESKREVRSVYGEYRKGILIGGIVPAIIFNYVGARRVHYGDRLDYRDGSIDYVGEGKRGDQKLNPRNKALVDASESQSRIRVFLDCGDLFKPKRLLFAGLWSVSKCEYSFDEDEQRKVFRFRLEPAQTDILDFLHFTFSAVGENPGFESDLGNFAVARAALYRRHRGIMRVRDNVIGEIGEYFAIKAYNLSAGENHLIRLTSAFKDLDAIRVATGSRFAIKTVGKFPSNTSNIWSDDIESSVDHFLLCHMDPDKLIPRFVCELASSRAVKLFETRSASRVLQIASVARTNSASSIHHGEQG